MSLCRDMMPSWEMKAEMDRQAARIEQLEAALRPFAEALKGNWSKQSDNMPMLVGPHREDLRLQLKLEDFRNARAALEDKR